MRRQMMMDIEGAVKNGQDIMKDIKQEFTRFIQTFDENGVKVYPQRAEKMSNNGKHLLVISFKHFMDFNNVLATQVLNNYYKYESCLNEAFSNFMHEYERSGMHQDANKAEETNKKEQYEITFDSALYDTQNFSVRSLKCQKLGKLIQFKGTITRTMEVRPQLMIGVFKCTACGSTSKPVKQQFKYTEPKKCYYTNCDNRSWQLDLNKSTFSDFQKIRVQQDPSSIPAGSMPRSIDVVLRNDNVQKGQPGDICRLIGYLCVLPDINSMLKPGERTQISTRSYGTRGNGLQLEGVKGLKGVRQLNYKLGFIARNIFIQNNQFQEIFKGDEEEEKEDSRDNLVKKQFREEEILSKIYSKLQASQIQSITRLKKNPNLYNDMAQSLFSSIFGQIEIKKALLLQLFGGIHKVTSNKINIRGDINILIVGDPSTAKSQFLKCVNKFVPRSVYTNGKTTSAAGLTASVTRDENGNVGIQAGALMLADNGICCIDQFDKMDLKDQVAIHEAMEQQTISIAKAGVYATLNARASILAAANPIFGRYDKSKSLKHNINLSSPIMSRFDLFFVICDQSNDLSDFHLSQFLVNMHLGIGEAMNTQNKINMKEIKTYISVAKKIKPMLTGKAAQLLRKYYKQIRSKDKSNNNNSYKVTVRQLQSMIRLSEAYARLSLSMNITQQHVKQAYRLLSCSIIKLQKAPIDIPQQDEQELMNMHSMNRAIENILEQQQRKKQQEKKSKSLRISHQLYEEVKKNTIKLFIQERQRHIKSPEDEDITPISQDYLCSYLIAGNYDQTFTIEQAQQMRKLMNALIKKMINEERILLIIEDSKQADKRILSLHPNYTE